MYYLILRLIEHGKKDFPLHWQINAVTFFDCWTRVVFVTMYSSVQCLCGLSLTPHCYVKPWAPCSSAQLCCHPLQACSEHSPLSSQRAAALLSLAKQLRAPTASTVVTCVKRALSLTHKTHAGRRATALCMATVCRAGLVRLHVDKKGTG